MPALLRLVLRDAAVLLLSLALWQYVHALTWLSAAGVALHVLAGIMVAVVAYLLHEWGHLLGAYASRSVVELPRGIAYLFLFKFDIGLNSRKQFLAMSLGGFIASGLTVWALLALLSWQRLADQVALVLTVLGVIATIVLEFPPAWKVLRGDPLPQQGPAFVNGADAVRKE